MSFSAEIKDFVSGFQAGSNVGGAIQDRKLSREKFDYDKLSDQEKMAFERDKFGFAKERAADNKDYRERAFALTKDRASKADSRAERSLKLREQAQNDRWLESMGTDPAAPSRKGGYSDTWYDDTSEKAYNDDEASASAIDVPVVDGEDPELAYRRGGMVLHAAGGALVPDETPEEETPEEAIPVSAPAAPEVSSEGKSDPLIDGVKPVIKEVMDASIEDEAAEASDAVDRQPQAIEVEKPNKPKKSQDRVRVVTGEGAATPEEIKAIDKTIDPNGELEPWRKGAARLYFAYNHFIERGEPEKARNIAKRIVAYDKMASQALGHLAKTAVEQNDLVSSSKLLSDAYNENVPDGQTLSAKPTERGTVIYKIERDGQTLEEGEATAREIWEMATKVADGSEFIDRMARIAGQAGSSGAGKGGNQRSYTEAVRSAATAYSELNALKDQIEAIEGGAGDEAQLPELKKQFNAMRVGAQKAMDYAERARVGTGRPMDVFQKDFNAAVKTALPAALPEAAPAQEEGGWFSGWFGGDEQPAEAPQQAIPEGAPANTPVTSAGKPMPPEILAQARAALAEGRSKAGVIKKLQDAGYSTEGL